MQVKYQYLNRQVALRWEEEERFLRRAINTFGCGMAIEEELKGILEMVSSSGQPEFKPVT